MRLKTMENVDNGKEKKHTDKLTDNPEDGTSYITCQWHAAVLDKRYLRLSNRTLIDVSCT